MGQLRRQLRGIGRWLVGQWRNNPLGSLLAIATLITLTYIYIETARHGRTGFAKQTLWDWMDLLLVPLALVIGGSLLGVILTHSVENRQRRDDLAEAIYKEFQENIHMAAHIESLLVRARGEGGSNQLVVEERNQIRAYGNWLDRIASLSNRNRVNNQLLNEWGLDSAICHFYKQTEHLDFLAGAREEGWYNIRIFCERRKSDGYEFL